MFLRLTLLLVLATSCNHLSDKKDNINLIGEWKWVEDSNHKKDLHAEGWIDILYAKMKKVYYVLLHAKNKQLGLTK